MMTKLGKVVRFSKSKYFSYVDVTNQPKWEESKTIHSFATNVYLLNKEKTQILRHKKVGNSFDAGLGYLKEGDVQSIGSIFAVGIDGGIYLLKSDLSLVKLFRTPTYRLESIVLNNLPRNYDIDPTANNKVDIFVRKDLNYVYMLLENRILVFEPNTKRYQDVKNLTYVGQIEGKGFEIKDFYVEKDGLMQVVTATGVYKLEFEINEGTLIVR